LERARTQWLRSRADMALRWNDLPPDRPPGDGAPVSPQPQAPTPRPFHVGPAPRRPETCAGCPLGLRCCRAIRPAAGARAGGGGRAGDVPAEGMQAELEVRAERLHAGRLEPPQPASGRGAGAGVVQGDGLDHPRPVGRRLPPRPAPQPHKTIARHAAQGGRAWYVSRPGCRMNHRRRQPQLLSAFLSSQPLRTSPCPAPSAPLHSDPPLRIPSPQPGPLKPGPSRTSTAPAARLPAHAADAMNLGAAAGAKDHSDLLPTRPDES
jgi:hypothetical protein